MVFRFIYRSFHVSTSNYLKLRPFSRFLPSFYVSVINNETNRQLQTKRTIYEKADAIDKIVTKSTDPVEYSKYGRQATEQWKASPYSDEFHVFMTMSDFIESYENLSPGEILKDVSVGVAGGIHDNHWDEEPEDKKTFFYDLYGEGFKIQIMADSSHYISEEEIFKFNEKVGQGDTIECIGYPSKTKEGDLCIVLTHFNVLTSCQHTPSNCLLDLVNKPQNPNANLKFNVKSYIMTFLEEMNFESSVSIPSDEVLDPVRTDPYALGLICYRFTQPELFLDMLQKGFQRVYEMDFVLKFGVTGLTHDFSSCEFYACNADSNILMQLLEILISGIVKTFTGSYKITYNPNGFEGNAYEIDFTPPFKRIEILPELESAMGEKFTSSDTEYFTTSEAKEKLLDLCIKYELECPPPRTTPRLLNKLVEHFLGEKLINPTYLCNHPIIINPFAKYCKTIPEFAKRFEMVTMKKKITNAYTLFNNPNIKLENFKAQDKSPDKYNFINEIFRIIRQCDLGPASGCIIDIDRLLMLMKNTTDIKDVSRLSGRPFFDPGRCI